MQRNDVAHRDLKPANLVLHFPKMPTFADEKCRTEFLRNFDFVKNADWVLKIADLGFAKEIMEGDTTETLLGTAQYCAPEIASREPYNSQCDVWSIGSIVYSLLVGWNRFPFSAGDFRTLRKCHERGGWKVDKDKGLSKETLMFLNECLVYSPSERITIEQMSSHPFITCTLPTSKFETP